MTKGKIAVALSGGLDSSVAALLLKEAGHEVVGIHACLWNSAHSQHQVRQAEAVCSTLDIPLYVVDLKREFELYVVDPFCREYERGRTPNPCIICNRHVKFGFLLDRALSMGADYVATGHYARIERLDDGYHLLRARDTSKDQSYFLYTLSQQKLGSILFPLGGYSKTEVQEVARQRGLPVAAKASQDICFIWQNNYRAFLRQRFSTLPGDIVDSQGRVLGHHEGIAFYTIGQRRGLGLASGKPLYVVRIEPEDNTIVLGSEKELCSQKASVGGVNWLRELPSEPIAVTVKIRYKSREAPATLFPPRHYDPEPFTFCHSERSEESHTAQGKLREEEAISVVWFSRPERAVTPGQAIVFYKGEEVLGGGVIQSTQLMAPAIEGEKHVATSKL